MLTYLSESSFYVYSKGILCGKLAQKIWRESAPFYLQLLQDAGLAVNVSNTSVYNISCKVTKCEEQHIA